MNKRKDRKTAAELMQELKADPRYTARKGKEEAKRQRQVARWREAEQPLVDDLRSVGVEVGSVWDLVNTSTPYPSAVPILIDHLQRSYPDRIREGIARALAVPEAKSEWKVLFDMFVRERDRSAHGPKWALACALGTVANDEVLSDVVTLLRDKRHGENRAPLLDALARSRVPQARLVLLQLREDEDLSGDVEKILSG